MVIAPSGHSSAHTPHSSHSASTMAAFSPSMPIACGGHASLHFSHPLHLSLSMTGINGATPDPSPGAY
jgi:hypothetical protein